MGEKCNHKNPPKFKDFPIPAPQILEYFGQKQQNSRCSEWVGLEKWRVDDLPSRNGDISGNNF